MKANGSEKHGIDGTGRVNRVIEQSVIRSYTVQISIGK
ncbi:hypothetical protein BTN50_0803 [Candidatus Enterovibrio altilux]|uniref:Uncharacterized protein n=1 Tax=Candidatus Enterovibrio altilux TaxID=1927128 RepID=A0A291B8K2_9GAMM|nr:hypothetical protein BTN50_0803 [Candidatus Enterovibrio luxaltus]